MNLLIGLKMFAMNCYINARFLCVYYATNLTSQLRKKFIKLELGGMHKTGYYWGDLKSTDNLKIQLYLHKR